jgi:hypothetical protein
MSYDGEIMSTWLRCTLYPGQFRAELIAVVRSSEGRDLSLFVQRNHVKLDVVPVENSPSEGWLKVQPLQEKEDKWLIRLPQTTVENGQFITVWANQFEEIPGAPRQQLVT